VFVSHKLNEVKEIADRVTDPARWPMDRHAPGDELTLDAMAQMMVGRELSDLLSADARSKCGCGDFVLEVRNLSTPWRQSQLPIFAEGEVLGFRRTDRFGPHGTLSKPFVASRPVEGGGSGFLATEVSFLRCRSETQGSPI
jgi:ribose transport system ATP-binding protein